MKEHFTFGIHLAKFGVTVTNLRNKEHKQCQIMALCSRFKFCYCFYNQVLF